MNNSSKQILSATGLLTVTMVWGLTFIMVKWTIAEIDIYYFLFLRFFAAFLLLLLFTKFKNLKTDRKTIKSAFILGSLLCISFILQTEALSYTTATNVSMITGLYIIFIPIFSYIFFKAKIFVSAIAGVLLSAFGMVLLTQYSYTGINFGDFLTLLCSVGYAWHVVFTGRFTTRHRLIPLVLYQFLLISIVTGIISLFRGGYTVDIPQIGWLTILVTSLFATVFAILIQTAAQRHIDSTRAGIIFSMEAAFGAFFAWMIGGEVLTTISLIGAIMMVFGMLISELHPISKRIFQKVFT